MTKNDIIRMAQEAGFVVDEKSKQHQPNCICHTYHMVDELLERFATLVAAAEREECSAIARKWDVDHSTTNYGGCIANEIIARGKA